MSVATNAVSHKPRVLIVDDSKIVRATLIKHLESSFDAREATDGIEAWETLLIDPNIRIVMTDLTMPRLDGYGLLKRIRESKIARIRMIPVVIITGAQEHDEHSRALAAGATDLVSKGITTSELLGRMEILVGLEAMHVAFDLGFQAWIKSVYGDNRMQLQQPETLRTQVRSMADAGREHADKLMVLVIRIGLQHRALTAYRATPSEGVLDAIGQRLGWSVRQTDGVAQTGASEFMLVTSSVPATGIRGFAMRICRTIGTELPVDTGQMIFVACGGLALMTELPDWHAIDPTIAADRLCDIATRRAALGHSLAYSGIVGAEEEKTLSS
ncbi:MAG: response regulator [Pseudomonadota bacterium]